MGRKFIALSGIRESVVVSDFNDHSVEVVDSANNNGL